LHLIDCIRLHPIALVIRYIRGAVREGWLTKQGGRIKTWKRRWVVLAAGGVLYYFDNKRAAAPKGVVPLEDIVVRSSVERSFAFSLSHSEAEGGRIKSAKALKSGSSSGSLIQGRHATFVFAAESDAERQRWIRALKKEARTSSMCDKPEIHA
jgi:cytohesin